MGMKIDQAGVPNVVLAADSTVGCVKNSQRELKDREIF